MSKNVLNVPFSEKNIAKSLGAKWDAVNKYWYVPEGLDLLLFARWLPKSSIVKQSCAKEVSSDKTLLVFLSEVAQTLLLEIKDKEWITAEISQITKHKSGHYYLDLVQHNDQGIVVAKTSAIIWKEFAVEVDRKFFKATSSKLSSDIKVMLLVKIQFDLVYGFKLIIEDIEPTYTLGDMAVKLKKIRQKLLCEKVFDLNKKHKLENKYHNVAVIAPYDGAGLGDFKKEADILDRFNLCNFDYYYASFQGSASPAEIKDKILDIHKQHKNKPYDVIVIIRGGGAVTDLAWLNNYELAHSICLSSLPVISGIGHRRDNTIIDEVSNIKFDTPSKVSAYIYNNILDEANSFMVEYKKLIDLIESKISFTRNNLAYMISNLKTKSLSLTVLIRSKLDNKFDTCIVQKKNHIALRKIQVASLYENQVLRVALHLSYDMRSQLRQLLIDYYSNYKNSILLVRKETEFLINRILGNDPNEIIKKGFVIARTEDGKSISSSSVARSYSQFLLQFRDDTLLVGSISEKRDE